MTIKFVLLILFFIHTFYSIEIEPSPIFQFQQQNDQIQRIYKSNINSISLRLHPNQDIMSQITKILSQSYKHNKLTALSIVSAVGSVNYCWLRMANQSTLTKIKGPLEIVSLSGTFDLNLSPHVHIAISKATGDVLGGHLPSLQQRQQAVNNHQNQIDQNILSENIPFDCPIFTTLQVSFLEHQNIIFQRKIDPETTFHQLTIRKKSLLTK